MNETTLNLIRSKCPVNQSWVVIDGMTGEILAEKDMETNVSYALEYHPFMVFSYTWQLIGGVNFFTYILPIG